MEVCHKALIEPRYSIPTQRIEIFAHWMELIAARRRLHSPRDIALIGDDIFVLKPDPGQRLVMVGPRRIGPFFAPRRTLSDNSSGVELIKGEHPSPLRVFA
jgi:hypothetical protein